MSVPVPEAPRRAPGVLLVVLMAAMSVGPIFNFAIGALSPIILEQFRISEAQYGLIITVIFLSAGITSTFLGVLADRLSVRSQFVIIFVGVLLAFLLSASWQTYVVLLLAALIAGPAQALSNPLTNRVIATKVPTVQRQTWMGWKQSGVQMGMLIAGLLFPLVAALVGWRGAALFGAALCVPLLVLAWGVVTRLDNASRQRADARALDEARATLNTEGLPVNTAGIVIGTGREPLPPAVWVLACISFLNAVGTQGLNSFASLFAVQALGYSVTVAGFLLGFIGVFGIASRIGWGRARGKFGRTPTLIQIMSLGGLLGFACLSAAELWQIDALMWLGMFFHAVLPLAANVIINSGIVDAAPAGRVGIASGLVAAAMYIGFSISPAIVGWIVDRTGDFYLSWATLSVTYVAAFIAAIVLSRLQQRDAA